MRLAPIDGKGGRVPRTRWIGREFAWVNAAARTSGVSIPVARQSAPTWSCVKFERSKARFSFGSVWIRRGRRVSTRIIGRAGS
jgi:hypothetical protein